MKKIFRRFLYHFEISLLLRSSVINKYERPNHYCTVTLPCSCLEILLWVRYEIFRDWTLMVQFLEDTEPDAPRAHHS